MPAITTRYFRDVSEAENRIQDMGLQLENLRTVRRVALDAARRANPYFPANAAGTFSYQYGTWALRDANITDDWHIDRTNGVECIRNDNLKIRIAFCNVDIACDDYYTPRARSDKGAGAERATQSTLFSDLEDFTSTEAASSEWSFYYFMLDPDGRVELTWPVVEGGKFVNYVERIYLFRDGSDNEAAVPSISGFDDDDIADGFEPEVSRKTL